jgi:microcystin-dependent protein
MAEIKISELPDASLPLAGTEPIPLVQAGDTKKATVANIVAGGLGYTPVNRAGDTMTGALNKAAPVTIASASSVAIGNTSSEVVTISGTTTITAFDAIAAGAIRFVTFSGALTLTHNGTSLILPGGANITTAAGDALIVQSLGSGNWRALSYTRASGLPVVDPTPPAPPTAFSSGMVMAFAFSTPPTGWLAANGAAVSRATYADLFTAIGVTFGVGDGVTTFNLPDLRAEWIRGWDDGRGIDTGRVFGSAQAEMVGSHTHDIAVTTAVSPSTAHPSVVDFASTGTFPTNANSGTENRPRNIALRYCIKT